MLDEVILELFIIEDCVDKGVTSHIVWRVYFGDKSHLTCISHPFQGCLDTIKTVNNLGHSVSKSSTG